MFKHIARVTRKLKMAGLIKHPFTRVKAGRVANDSAMPSLKTATSKLIQPGVLASHASEPKLDANRDEIALDDVKAADSIIIQTLNSAYIFSVTDAIERRGTLTGGVLEARIVNVRLLSVDFDKLKVGSRALFLVESSDGIRRILTSTITRLSHEGQHYTCVPPGSGVRMGIDRDLDGVLGGDE